MSTISWMACYTSIYTGDSCINHFTPQQVARMHCYVDLVYKSWVDTPTPSPVPLPPTVSHTTPPPPPYTHYSHIHYSLQILFIIIPRCKCNNWISVIDSGQHITQLLDHHMVATPGFLLQGFLPALPSMWQDWYVYTVWAPCLVWSVLDDRGLGSRRSYRQVQIRRRSSTLLFIKYFLKLIT